MGYTLEKIGINKLDLDLENPRYRPVSSQEEAFEQMIGTKKRAEKVKKIAEHILNNGLNPTTTISVYRSLDGRNIVKDGNRRVTAIKAMMYPKMVKNDRKLRNYFEKLGASINRTNYQYLNCIVFDNEIEADTWVKVNHQNDSAGIGQEDWESLAKMRDSAKHGVFEPLLIVYDRVMDLAPDLIDEDEFKMSVFERVLNSTDFRNYAGITFTRDSVLFENTDESFISIMSVVIEDSQKKKGEEGYIDTRVLNTTEDVKRYIEDNVRKGRFLPMEVLAEPTVVKNEPRIISNVVTPAKKTRRKKNVLIDKNLELIINKKRISDIFNDLKTYDARKHTNSVAVLFRTFIELSVSYHMECNGIKKGSCFAEDILETAKDLKLKNRITNDVMLAVKMMTKRAEKDSKEINIATELNQYAHNYEYNPTYETIEAEWQSMSSLIRAIFSDKS